MRHRRSAGQSTVEFALIMLLMFGFILFFLQLSMVFGYGNYTHYATFMAARALLAAGPDAEDQQSRAQNYLALMLKQSTFTPGIERFPSLATGVGGPYNVAGMETQLPDYDPNTLDYSWSQGIRYTFKSRLFPMGIGTGSAAGAAQSTVTFKSESWLGREDTADHCAAQLKLYDPHGKGIFDNGC